MTKKQPTVTNTYHHGSVFFFELLDRSIGKNSYKQSLRSFSAISDFGVTLCCMLRDSYVIQLCYYFERTCTSESINLRPYFLPLQYHLRSLLSLVTLLFLYFSDYENLYLPSILHLYHHLFAELVHLYNLPLYWVCWGHK